VKYANAMSEPGMACSGIDQIGKAQLLNPAKTLERSRLHDLPEGSLQFGVRKFNEVMHRVADALIRHFASRQEACSLFVLFCASMQAISDSGLRP
jgi:hypothetical protein